MQADSRIYYGHWLIVAGFVTQFVSVGAQNYSIGAFMVPMTPDAVPQWGEKILIEAAFVI